MNLFKRFQAGDKVTYIGSKYAQKLSGSVGVVDAHVQNSESTVVVTFGDDSYVMDEYKHLTRFQGRLKDPSPEGEREKPKDVEVTRRRGSSKRRSAEDSE